MSLSACEEPVSGEEGGFADDHGHEDFAPVAIGDHAPS
jgi:hypothetical protein